MSLYSEKVMDHFLHPRNLGSIEDANGIGEVGNVKCGDIMKMYLKIEDDVIKDVKFETFGCGSAIASSSMATELIKGKPVEEAMELTNKAVAEALDGLPDYKMHCSVLAEEAIKAALDNYKNGVQLDPTSIMETEPSEASGNAEPEEKEAEDKAEKEDSAEGRIALN
ncbi:MAG: Fe-S cluster assembly scaffold protein NifU [Eubacterium sp.]|nr:Fe-S cluster assembly scaffold protein NifU [Eubacterium sp.]